MFLRDLAIYADKLLVDRFPGGFVQRFHRETCCVVELYLSHLLREAETGEIAKVQLEFTDSLKQPPKADCISRLINVLVVPWPFEFEAYERAHHQMKKESVAEALLAALLWLCDVHSWSKHPFEDAFQACARHNWTFEGFSKASWSSPSKRFRARIFFRYGIDQVELFAVLYKNRSKEEIIRKRLGSGVPEMGCLEHFLRKAQWNSETRFSVSGTDFRHETWQADFADIG